MTICPPKRSVHLDNPVSRSGPDQSVNRNSQRVRFDHACAATIPSMCTNGYGWSDFTDFSPAAIDWLRANQGLVRGNKSVFKRQRTTRRKADEAWARLAR